MGQGVVFQPALPSSSRPPVAAVAVAAPAAKPLARPRTEEDRIQLERSTRKALEDAQFWDLPIEEALRSLRQTRSHRKSQDQAQRVAEAFHARQERSKSQKKQRSPPRRSHLSPSSVEPQLRRMEGFVEGDWKQSSEPKMLPSRNTERTSQVASIQIRQPTDIVDPDTFSAQFIQAAARAAGVDPARLRIKRVTRSAPTAAPTRVVS
eukprot:symbB.v1.2.004377.t1/scaffold246.1/size253235/3